MKKLLAFLPPLAVLAVVAAVSVSTAVAAPCQTVTTSKGTLTAALVDTPATGDIDASGCDIGAYYDTNGSVTNANIHGAQSYGVFVDGNLAGNTAVDVTNSAIHDIGDTPFDGVQRGVAVYYYGYLTPGTVSGTVSGNTVSRYQKGGIVVNGANATVTVTGNTVTGLGKVDFIAQNGVQFGFGANGLVRGNAISDNFYTGTAGVGPNPGGQNPPGWEYTSAGLLLYQTGDVKNSQNKFSGNQKNVSVAN